MKDYQSIVDRMRIAVTDSSHGSDERCVDLSQEYAQVCEEVNRRLQECAVYLRGGNYSEAIRLANTTPHLLDVCATLQFSELEEWKSLCREIPGTTPVEPLLGDVIALLNGACDSASETEPLLKKLRLFALARSPVSDRLVILYQLDRLEPYNMIWSEMITEYESAAAAELEENFERLRAAKETAALNALWEKWRSIPWKNRPEQLARRLSEWRKSVMTEQMFAQLYTVTAEMISAYEKRDFSATVQNKAKWLNYLRKNRLETSAMDRDQQRTVISVLNWIKEETRLRKQRDGWQEKVKSMEEALEEEESPEVLSEAYRSLVEATQACGETIPPALESAYRARIDKKRRLFRMMVMGGVGVVALLLIFTVISIVSCRGGGAESDQTSEQPAAAQTDVK